MGFRSWTKHAGSWLASFFKNSNWAHSASVGLALAGPPAILILRDTMGASAGTEATNVVAEVQKDLSDITVLLAEAQHSPNDATVIAKVEADLGLLKSNLGTILTDAHVKDSAHAEKITEIVGALVEEIDAILSMIPVNTQGPAAS